MDHRVSVIEPPAAVVSWEEMKSHCRLDDDTEKLHMEVLVAGATSWLDGPTGWLGRSIGVQLLEYAGEQWPGCLTDLPYGRVLEVTAVVYVDPDGVEHELPKPYPNNLMDFPDIRGEPGDIRIQYYAGFGLKDPEASTGWVNDVPQALRVAIMLLAAQWFENREAVAVGVSVSDLPYSVSALIQPYRIYR